MPASRVRSAPPPALREGVSCVYAILSVESDLGDLVARLEGLGLAGATEARTCLRKIRRHVRRTLLRFDAQVAQAVRAWEQADDDAADQADDEAPF